MWCAVGLALLIQASLTLANPYYGKPIGALTTRQHGVSGMVYAADASTIVITDFNYDGEGPDTFIWIGTSSMPGPLGTIVPIVRGSETKLREYTGQILIVTLPGPMTIADYKWISVWCRMAQANFGDVFIPDNFVHPSPADLGSVETRAHLVSANNVQVVNSKTIIFTNLVYDGNGPDAYFWADSRIPPTPMGTKLIWKTGSNNMGKNQVLTRAFNGEVITVHMPGEKTVYDFNNFGLWCVSVNQNFGEVQYDSSTFYVPAVVDIPPPSLYPNCEVLVEDRFQVQWRVDGSKITIELAGRVEPGEYLAFGLSGSETRTLMDGSDVVVAWMDKVTMSPKVNDYNLQSKAQCSVNDGRGACPDTLASGREDVMLQQLLFDQGIPKISYYRDLVTGDSIDKDIPLNRSVYISWAMGPINDDDRVAKHDLVPLPGVNPKINFGRGGSSCQPFESSGGPGNQLPPWPESEIKDETTFRVEIGQSGGERGYTAITGTTGWGIAWYVNGQLIPTITVKRGVTYTFQVYGGDNRENSAQYHPFYITDDPKGGLGQRNDQEKAAAIVYAGPVEGPYCVWGVKQELVGVNPNDFNTFDKYKANLERTCAPGSGGTLTWTPDENTPDEVYYQCYTHRFLGWKIKVSSATEVKISLVLLFAMVGVTTFF